MTDYASLPREERQRRAQTAADAERDHYWATKKPTQPDLREIIQPTDPRYGHTIGPTQPLLTGRAARRARGLIPARPRALTPAESPLVDPSGTLGRLTHRTIRDRAGNPTDVTFRTVLTPRGAL